jgi:hypothetical protein
MPLKRDENSSNALPLKILNENNDKNLKRGQNFKNTWYNNISIGGGSITVVEHSSHPPKA